MLIVITAAFSSMAALAPLNPPLPLTVSVTTPDGQHRLVPIDNTSGRLLAVCAPNTSGGDPVCAPVVSGRRGARAAFQESDPIDSNGELRPQIASPEMGSDGVTAIAVGCGLLGGAAVGGAVIAGAVAEGAGANTSTVDGANTAAAGLWLLGGVSVVGAGVATFFAVMDNAPQIE